MSSFSKSKVLCNTDELLVNWNDVELSPAQRERLELVKQSTVHEKISGYEGFGSFHSGNVEDLMSMSDAEYKPPARLPMFARKILTKPAIAAIATAQVHDAAGRTRLLSEKRRRAEAREASPPLRITKYEEGATPGLTSHSSTDTDDTTEHGGLREDDKSSSRVALTGTSDASAIGPPPSTDLASLLDEPVRPCAFGAEFREQHFTITDSMVFINHGAFGSSLAGALEIKRRYEDMMESEVVDFVDRELLPLIVHSVRSLSRFLHADPHQVVLVQNATYALNCAMRMIERHDVVAFLDTEYLSVFKMLWYRCKEVGASHHEITLSKYLHDARVMGDDHVLTEEICRQLPAGCTAVVVDYVTSTSALCLPVFSHIIPALRRRGVHKIIVDGAHAPLQINLNFNALPPDSQPTVFVGNLHKWFSSPKSVGFFWVRAEDAELMHSVVLSHGAGDGLLSEFIWDGTRDYGAYLSIPATVSFWEAQGCDRVRRHCEALLKSAADMLTTAFRSRRVARHSPFMSLIELPEELQDDYVTARYIQDVLHDVYGIEVPVKFVEGRYYVRISVFVYNAPQDYAYLRDAICSIADKWFHSEERRSMRIAAMHTPLVQSTATTDAGGAAPALSTPCDERIRRQGGCGVSGLDPSLKRKKTAKFS